MQKIYILKCMLYYIIYLSRTPYLSRTHDIEALFTSFSKINPYLSRGLNQGFYGTVITLYVII